jgi:hypothetical protein
MFKRRSISSVSEPQNPVISPLSKMAEKSSINLLLVSFEAARRQLMFSQRRGLIGFFEH